MRYACWKLCGKSIHYMNIVVPWHLWGRFWNNDHPPHPALLTKIWECSSTLHKMIFSRPHIYFKSPLDYVQYLMRHKWYVNICCVYVKLLQLCPTLCDPMDYSPPGSSVHGFSRQEYWSGLPCLPPGDLPNPGIKPAALVAPALQADSLPLSYQGSLSV